MNYPQFVAKGTADATTGVGAVSADATPAYMGSIQPGDLLIILAVVTHPGALVGSITLPAGYTSIGANASFNDNIPVYAGNLSVFIREATGSESGTVNVTGFSNVNFEISAQIYQYRATRPKMIVESVANKNNGDGAATVTWNALTLAGGARTLFAFSGNIGGSPGAITGYTTNATDAPGGTTLRVDTLENVSSDGAVTASGGSSSGWATSHISVFCPAGRNFIVN